MANTIETKLKGKVIAYHVRPFPKKTEARGKGVTVTKAAKIGASLEIRVDKETHFVPSNTSEIVAGESVAWVDADTEPGSDLYKQVFNTLVDSHPCGAEREFSLFEQKGKGRPRRWYELKE